MLKSEFEGASEERGIFSLAVCKEEMSECGWQDVLAIQLHSWVMRVYWFVSVFEESSVDG